MQLIKIFSWGSYALGALFALLAMVEGELMILAPALASVIIGALFAAIDPVIALLSDIRDGLTTDNPNAALEEIEPQQAKTAPVAPDVSIKDLDDSLQQLKRRLGKS